VSGMVTQKLVLVPAAFCLGRKSSSVVRFESLWRDVAEHFGLLDSAAGTGAERSDQFVWRQKGRIPPAVAQGTAVREGLPEEKQERHRSAAGRRCYHLHRWPHGVLSLVVFVAQRDLKDLAGMSVRHCQAAGIAMNHCGNFQLLRNYSVCCGM